ncbi:MAG: hypothetical protein KGY54_06495 [Oleiphilaceae bacterium]|nr:hypothetical protein [Oleiphilaceae bacterium]
MSLTRLPLLAIAVLTLAMLSSLGWQGYEIWQTERLNTAVSGNSPSDNAGPDLTPAPDITLAGINLFGDHDKQSTPIAESTENLPDTNLRLFLRGVMAADGDHPASALVEDSKNRTEAYVVGDQLPGDASLHSVHRQRIIIERGGKLENLYFPELKDSGGLQVADNSESARQAVSSPSRSIRPESSQSAQPSQARQEEIRERLQQLRDRLKNSGS